MGLTDFDDLGDMLLRSILGILIVEVFGKPFHLTTMFIDDNGFNVWFIGLTSRIN